MKKIIFSEHALFQMRRRGISEMDVNRIIESPEQTSEVRPGRAVFQARIMVGEPARALLVRVFVDVGKENLEVVTVYRTSKIDKYWR